jgi:hypothetical protein
VTDKNNHDNNDKDNDENIDDADVPKKEEREKGKIDRT